MEQKKDLTTRSTSNFKSQCSIGLTPNPKDQEFLTWNSINKELHIPDNFSILFFSDHSEAQISSDIMQKEPQPEKTKELNIKEIKKLVMKIVNLRRTTVKNVNIPKFLFRIFGKYALQYADEFKNDEKAKDALLRLLQQLQQWGRQSKNHYISLNHLQKMFGTKDKLEKNMNSATNRRIMHLILTSKLKNQIIKNLQVKQKISYLNAVKIYSLRCMNETISSRVQSK